MRNPNVQAGSSSVQAGSSRFKQLFKFKRNQARSYFLSVARTEVEEPFRVEVLPRVLQWLKKEGRFDSPNMSARFVFPRP